MKTYLELRVLSRGLRLYLIQRVLWFISGFSDNPAAEPPYEEIIHMVDELNKKYSI